MTCPHCRRRPMHWMFAPMGFLLLLGGSDDIMYPIIGIALLIEVVLLPPLDMLVDYLNDRRNSRGGSP